MNRGLWMIGAVAALALSACGSDPGSGTKTLYVDAEAYTDGTADGTTLDITVRQGSSSGNYVTDAAVTVTGDRGGVHQLPYVGVSFLGWYRLSNFAWEPGWRLNIERGADRLQAYIQAPGITTMTEPVPGTVFNRAAQQDLVIKWRDEDGRSAQNVEVTTDKGSYDRIETTDPGNRAIPFSSWTQAEPDERIDVRRWNEINLAGGAPASTFKATSRGRVPVQIQ